MVFIGYPPYKFDRTPNTAKAALSPRQTAKVPLLPTRPRSFIRDGKPRSTLMAQTASFYACQDTRLFTVRQANASIG